MKVFFQSNPFVFFFIFFLFVKNSSGSMDKNSVAYTALELSNSYAINPFNTNQFFFQSCLSLKSLTKNYDNWFYPDIGFGYKVSKNLAMTGSVFSYESGNVSYQRLGAGIQYFFGSTDTLSWVSSLKRVNSKAIKSYYIDNLTFDICKWIQYKTIFLRFGSGASFYKKVNFLTQSSSQKGKINFIFISTVLPLKIFQFGLEARINSNRFLYSLFLQKDFY